MRRYMPAVLLLLVGSVGLPTSGEAQFRILPSAGIYAPLSDLNEIRDQDGMTVIEAGRRSSTLALGLAGELGGVASQAGLRLQLGYATASNVPISGVGCEGCELRSTLLTATGALVLRPFPDLAILRPHLVIGGGVKRYGFDRDDLREEGWDQVLRNQTQRTLQLGIGSTVNLGILSPQVELGAFVSRIDGVGSDGSGASAEDDRQTDLFLMVSIPILGR